MKFAHYLLSSDQSETFYYLSIISFRMGEYQVRIILLSRKLYHENRNTVQRAIITRRPRARNCHIRGDTTCV